MKLTIFYLFSLLLILLFSCKPGVRENKNGIITLPIDKDVPYIVIPVHIGGVKYNFLLDTGADITVINYTPQVAELLKSSEKKLYTGVIKFFSEDRYGEYYYTYKPISLGDASTVCKLYLHGYQDKVFPPFPSAIIDNNLDGFIGMDVFRKYNWYCDFIRNELLLSKDEIQIPDIPDKSTVFKIAVERDKTVFTMLKLNDSIESSFTFDTGYLNDSINIGARKVFSELVLSDTLMYILNKKYTNNININSDSVTIQLIPNISVNDTPLRNLAALRSPGNKKNENVITSAFLKRLNGMYYDFMKSELTFYVNEQADFNQDVGLLVDRILKSLYIKASGKKMPLDSINSKQLSVYGTEYTFNNNEDTTEIKDPHINYIFME